MLARGPARFDQQVSANVYEPDESYKEAEPVRS
jgi:hypothetical protein